MTATTPTETALPSTTLGALLDVGKMIYNPFFVGIAGSATSTTSLDRHAARLGWHPPFSRNLRLAGQAFIKNRPEVMGLLAEREVRAVDATYTFLEEQPFAHAEVRLSNEFCFGGLIELRSHWPTLLREAKLQQGDKVITSFDFAGEFETCPFDLTGAKTWKWHESDWTNAEPEFSLFGHRARIGRMSQGRDSVGMLLKVDNVNVWAANAVQIIEGFPVFHRAVFMEMVHTDKKITENIRFKMRIDAGPHFASRNSTPFGRLEYERIIHLPEEARVRLTIPYDITAHDLCGRMMTYDLSPVRIENGKRNGAVPRKEAVKATDDLLLLNEQCWTQGMKKLETIVGRSFLLHPPAQLSALFTSA